MLPSKPLRHPWPPPNRPSLWWRCAVTTDLAKSAPKCLPGAMPDVMAALASAARAPVATVARVLAAWVIAVPSAAATVLAIAHPVKTEAPA